MGSVVVYAKENRDTKKRNAELQQRKALRNKAEKGEASGSGKEQMNTYDKDTVHRKTFTWEAVNYTVPIPGGQARLLHDVYGYVKPGTLVCTSAVT